MPRGVDSRDRSLGSILSAERRITVPPYQRTFTWKAETIVQLWDDILSASSEDSDSRVLFLGPLVFSREGSEVWLVDGQQRLTTLSLLVAACWHELDGRRHASRARLEQGFRLKVRAEALLYVRGSPDGTLRLKLSEHDDAAYSEFVRRGSTASAPRILAAADKKIKQLLADQLEHGNLEDFLTNLFDTLENALIFAEVMVTDPCDPYSVFEALNSKGEYLLQADLIKNRVLQEVRDISRDRVLARWGELSRQIPRERLSRYLRSWWISQREFVPQKKLYKAIRPSIRGSDLTVELVEKWFDHSRYYKWISEGQVPAGEGADSRLKESLEEFSKLGFEAGKPVLLGFLIGGGRRLVPSVVDELARIYIRVLKSSQRRGSIFEEEVKDICSQVRSSPEAGLTHLRSVANRLCTDAGDLDWGGLYVSDGHLQKYILAKLSQHERLDGPTYRSGTTMEVEHILPQTRPPGYLSSLGDEDYDQLVDHIGNLTLILDSDNGSCYNHVFQEKRLVYRNYRPRGTKLPTMTGLLGNRRSFIENDVYNRARDLAALAEDIWPRTRRT